MHVWPGHRVPLGHLGSFLHSWPWILCGPLFLGFYLTFSPSSVPRTPNSPPSTSMLLVPPLKNQLHPGCPPGLGPAHSSLSIWAMAPLSPSACCLTELTGPPVCWPCYSNNDLTSLFYLWGSRNYNYQLSRCGHQEQLHPFKAKQLFCLLRHFFLKSIPKEDILILLGKSTFSTTPGLGFLEGGQGRCQHRPFL